MQFPVEELLQRLLVHLRFLTLLGLRLVILVAILGIEPGEFVL